MSFLHLFLHNARDHSRVISLETILNAILILSRDARARFLCSKKLQRPGRATHFTTLIRVLNNSLRFLFIDCGPLILMRNTSFLELVFDFGVILLGILHSRLIEDLYIISHFGRLRWLIRMWSLSLLLDASDVRGLSVVLHCRSELLFRLVLFFSFVIFLLTIFWHEIIINAGIYLRFFRHINVINHCLSLDIIKNCFGFLFLIENVRYILDIFLSGWIRWRCH
jgi:hypothetical protein